MGVCFCAQRFLDNVQTESGAPLSDHFGVKVTLKDVHSNCKWWEDPAPPSTPSLVLEALGPSLKRLCATTAPTTS